MSSTVTNLSPVQVRIDVQVPKSDVTASTQRVLQRISREVRVPGFRKGKAPPHMLKRLFGKAVLDDVREELVSQHMMAALETQGLYPLSQPDYEFGDLAEGEDFSFSVRFEVSPRLDELVTEGVTVDKFCIVPDPSVVEKELARLQSNMATIKDFETSRPVAPGDMVQCEVRSLVNGELAEEALPQKDFLLTPDSAPGEMIEALIGKNVGDRVEFVFGADSSTSFQCHVLAHKERILPEIDDELARDVGDFETLDGLKADIEKRHVTYMEQREEERLRQAVFEALCEKNPMELPPTLLEKQVDANRQRFESMMARMSAQTGADAEDAPVMRFDEQMDKSAREDARKLVHQHFLVEEIGRRQNIEVTEEDVDAALRKTAEATGLPLPRVRAEYNKGGRMMDFKTLLLERKVFDFVLPLITIAEKDMPKDADENSDSPAAEE